MKLLSTSYLKYGVCKVFQRIKNVLTDYSGWHEYMCFVGEMNRFAREHNMNQTKYHNPSGATRKSRTSPSDLLRLGECAIEHTEIIEMWTCANRSIHIRGGAARVLTIENNVLRDGKPIMGEYLIGGKSGSWGEENKAHFFLCDVEGNRFLISVLAKDQYCFTHIYEIGLDLCMLASQSKKSLPYLNALKKCMGGFVGKYEGSGENSFCFNGEKAFLPASTTKIMTALLALQINPQMSGDVSIYPLDISNGSGPDLFPGDTVTFSEALYIMMLESSNTMANAIARTCGSLLRKQKNRLK